MRRVQFLVIFLALLTASIGGGWIALRSVLNREGALEATRREAARAELRLLSSAVSAELKELQQRIQSSGSSPELVHWAEVEVAEGGRPARMLQAVRTPRFAKWAGTDESGFERSYLDGVSRELGNGALRGKDLALFQVRPDSASSQELLCLAFPVSDSKIVLALLSPMEAFPVFSASHESTFRYYLIASDGVVLAHSEPSYVGAHYDETSVFRQGVLKTLQERGGPGAFAPPSVYTSIDQLPVTAAFAKLGNLPFALAVEVVSVPAVAFKDSVAIAAEITVLALLLLGIAILISVFPRGMRGQKPKLALPAVESAMEAMVEAQAERVSELAIAASHEDAIVSGNEMIDEFEAEARLLNDPKGVSERLVGLASGLYRAPALFFRYSPSSRVAILESSAGLGETMKSSGMSFPVNDRAIAHISDCLTERSIASLARYPALLQTLSSRLNAHSFDAWAVTGPTPAGGSDGQAWILGFLVILRENVAEQAHESVALARMMRASGLVYGKAILSQS